MSPEPIAAGPTAAITAGLRWWNSPIPYLFGGLAIMLGLIAFALVVLACSYRNSISTEDEEKPVKPVHSNFPEMEPKTVVILAGHEVPTCLAKPVRRSEQAELDV